MFWGNDSASLIRSITHSLNQNRGQFVALQDCEEYKLQNKEILSSLKQLNVKILSFNSNELYSGPYFPLVDLIAERVSQLSKSEVDNLFKNCNVPIFHKRIIENYIDGSTNLNPFFGIMDEIAWEEQQFKKDVMSLFKELYRDSPIIISVSNVQKLAPSSYIQLSELLGYTYENPILWILHYEPQPETIGIRRNRNWNGFLDFIMRNGVLVGVPKKKGLPTLEKKTCSSDLTPHLEKAASFMLFKDILFLLSSLDIYSLEMSCEDDFKIVYYKALTHQFNQNQEEMQKSYHYLYYSSQKNHFSRYRFLATQGLALYYYEKNEKEAAMHFIGILKTISFSDIHLRYQFDIINFYFTLNWKLLSQEQILAERSRLISKSLNRDDTRLYVFLTTCSILNQSSNSSEWKFFEDGLKIAEKEGYLYREASGYHELGNYYYHKGESKKSNNAYMKSLSIWQKIEDNKGLLEINREIGTRAMARGELDLARKYFSFFEKLKDESSIFPKYIDSLYCAAKLYLFSMDYEKSLKCLKLYDGLSQMLDIEISPQRRVRFLSIEGLNYYLLNRVKECKATIINLKVINERISMVGYNSRQFLYYLFLSIASDVNHFNELEKMIKKRKEFGEGPWAFYNLVRAEFETRNGQYIKGEKRVKKLLSNSTKKGSSFIPLMQNWLYPEKGVTSLFAHVDIVPDGDSYLARFESYSRSKEYLWRSNQVDFLNFLRRLINSEKNRRSLIERVLELFIAFFHLNQVWFCRHSEEGLLVEASLSTGNITSPRYLNNIHIDIDNIWRTFFSIDNFTSESRLIIPVIQSELGNYHFLIISGLQSRLDEDSLRFFDLVGKQFASGINRIKQRSQLIRKSRRLLYLNEKLEKSSVTDPLTGAYNRIGLKQMLERLYEEDDDQNYWLLFIDLDNFKVYNDKLGHPVGDQLLYDFAKYLQKECRSYDRVFRYGGDEFVVLVAEPSFEMVEAISERIIRNMNEGFLKPYKEREDQADIQQNKRLSCSIGISCFKEEHKSYEDILVEADRALYRAKDLGKGISIFWEKSLI